MSSREEAIRDARSHIDKGTGLSDEAVRRICAALVGGPCEFVLVTGDRCDMPFDHSGPHHAMFRWGIR